MVISITYIKIIINKYQVGHNSTIFIFSPARASAVGCFRQAKVRISTFFFFFLNEIHGEVAVET